MKARVRMLDNARESVDGAGRIRGIRATGTIANRASGMASSVALFDPLMFAWARSSSVALLRFPNPEISLPIGTELFIELTASLTLPRRSTISRCVFRGPPVIALRGCSSPRCATIWFAATSSRKASVD